MLEKPKRVFEFGPFRLDSCERLLFRAGNSVPLTPKAFELLLILVDSQGHLMPKDDLMKRVWPESFVEETNLTHHISVLRNALGEDGGPFIETVPRRGYRFVAPVTEQVEDEPANLNASAVTKPVLAAGGRRYLWLAVALAGLCALAVLVWRSTAVRSGGSAVPREVPLTSYPGMELFPSFSPDGSQVAFSWLKQGEKDTDIYIQQVGGGTPLRLTDDPAHDWSPSWSPDGRLIAFVRFSHSGDSSLFVMPALPGKPRKIADLTARYVRQHLYTGTNVTWSPNSKWIVVTDALSADSLPLVLLLVSVETGERRQLTRPPPGFVLDGAPAFSPDSRRLAFVRTQNLESREIFVIRLADDLRPIEPAVQLTSLRRFVGSPVWTADGREILFLAGATMKGGQLWRMRLPDGEAGATRPELVPAPFEASSLLAIRYHRDGSARLAYMRRIFDPNIWAVNLRDRTTPAQAPRILIASTLEDYNAQFSVDGSSIVFQSYRSGNPEIWKSDRDGSNAEQLTFFKGPYTGWPSWSPDGRWIVFHSGPEGSSDIYAMKSEGGVPKRLTHVPANDAQPTWSRDGRWIYFVSDRSGDRQVWKMRFQFDLAITSPEPLQVTKGGGNRSLESLDGKMLYYSKGLPHRPSLWSVGPDGSEEPQVLDFVPFGMFAPVSDGIYFLARSGPGMPGRVQFLNSDTRNIRTVLSLEKPSFYGLSVSPDGGTLLFSQVDREESDIMMVDNWRP
jgi:Tol biopolymer transport system component/DNA-binding winged helix-turn-helix (wHTH) protein